MKRIISALSALCLCSFVFLASCANTGSIQVSSIVADAQLVENGISTIVNNSDLLSSLSTEDKTNINNALTHINTVLDSLEANATGTLTLSTAQGDVKLIETDVNTVLSIANAVIASGTFKESDTLKTAITAINVLIPTIETVVDMVTTKAVMHTTANTMTVTEARQFLATVH